MKKILIKILILIVVFVIGLLTITYFTNQTSTQMSEKMSEATLPVVYFVKNQIACNPVYGYLEEVDLNYVRNGITQVSEKRELEFCVDMFGEELTSISYEVRSADGSRLIENGSISEIKKNNDTYSGTIRIKDLIEKDVEYKIVFILGTKSHNEIRYISTIIWNDQLYESEKLEFIQNFHDKTFDKENAQEIVTYLESDRTGENWGYQYSNIHSSFDHITWGDLKVEKLYEPKINITELDGGTAYAMLQYLIQIKVDNKWVPCFVEERYRVRYTSNRMYLLDFEREVEQYFHIENDNYAGNTVSLGIVDPNLVVKESEDNNVKAFIINNNLYSFNATSDAVSVVFSFYQEGEVDIRNSVPKYKIEVLQVAETGNITYAVYGYMNRGNHEGEIGVQIVQYDSSANTNIERLWIPYHKSPEMLQAELDTLIYLNANEKLFLNLESSVYSIDLNDHTVTEAVRFSFDGSVYISDNKQFVVYQSGREIYKSNEVVLLDLKNTKAYTVYTGADEYILPLGFIGEDVVVGRAYIDDIKNGNSATVFPMYQINIINSEGKIIKTYEQEGVYIPNCVIEKDQIILERTMKNEKGQFVEIESEYIMNNEVIATENILQTVVTDQVKTSVQMKVKSSNSTDSLKFLYADNVILEGELTLDLESDTKERYYVYGIQGLEGVYLQSATAVKKAAEIAGVVRDEQGNYMWRQTTRAASNQIMAIKASGPIGERSSLAVCLDTMLGYEGITRNSQLYLSQGKTIFDILQDNLPDTRVLNLMDTNLDSLLYYTNLDLPVLVSLKDGNAILIIGYNSYNIVVMNPNTGTIYKMGMEDAAAWLEQETIASYTYIRK